MSINVKAENLYNITTYFPHIIVVMYFQPLTPHVFFFFFYRCHFRKKTNHVKFSGILVAKTEIISGKTHTGKGIGLRLATI